MVLKRHKDKQTRDEEEGRSKINREKEIIITNNDDYETKINDDDKRNDHD